MVEVGMEISLLRDVASTYMHLMFHNECIVTSLKLDGMTLHEWSLLPPYHLGLWLCEMNVKLLCGRCIINIGNRLLVVINGPLWYNQIKCYNSFPIFFLLDISGQIWDGLWYTRYKISVNTDISVLEFYKYIENISG